MELVSTMNLVSSATKKTTKACKIKCLLKPGCGEEDGWRHLEESSF